MLIHTSSGLAPCTMASQSFEKLLHFFKNKNRTLFFGLWKTTQASNNIMFSKNTWHREFGVDSPTIKAACLLQQLK